MRAIASFLFLIAAQAQAQDPVFIHHTPRSQYLFPEEADITYVLVDGTPVHDAPSLEAPVLLRATSGTALSVVEVLADTLMFQGIGSYWYQVEVGAVQGWTWGGGLAQWSAGSHADPTVKFYGGIDHVTPSDTGRYDFSYRLVAVKGGKEVDRIVVRSFAWGFEDVRNNGDLGLKNVDDVITLSVPCVGGCGCTTGQVVVFWSGGRFHHATDLMGTPDGAYSENRMFIYPADVQGLPDAIIQVISTYEETEAPNEEGEEPTNTLTRLLLREQLRWDGKALVPVAGSKSEQRYVMDLDE